MEPSRPGPSGSPRSVARSAAPVHALGNLRVARGVAARLARGGLAVLVAGALPQIACAGAWLMAEGKGQLIGGPIFSGTTRAFDARGRVIPVPYYNKFELGTFIEYGLSKRLTVVAAPSYDRVKAADPSQTYNGLGESLFGGKFGIYRDDSTIVAVQAGVLTPGPSIANSTGPFNPRRSLGVELRGLVGRSFEVATLPAFVDVQGGYRYYTQNQPGEWRLDVTLGLRPIPKLLWLVQTFSVYSNAGGGGFVRYSWHKVASSIVVDLHPQWAIQAGGFLTVAGVNAGLERGPFASLWYRF